MTHIMQTNSGSLFLADLYRGTAIKYSNSDGIDEEVFSYEPKLYGVMQMWQNEMFNSGFDKVIIEKV